MRYALPASVLAHAGFAGAALLVMAAPPPPEAVTLEAVGCQPDFDQLHLQPGD